MDEKKLRAILAEHDKDFKQQVGRLQEDTKRHVGLLAQQTDERFQETNAKIEIAQSDVKRHAGVLHEETHRKFDLVLEGYQGLSEKMDQLREEVASIRREIEEIRLHLFRKADLQRLEALEERVAALEKRTLGR